MRLAVFFGAVLALALFGYLAVSAYFLAKAASGLMTVGPLAQAIAAAPPTSDPLSLGFRGPPDRALGLTYQTVAIETPLGPAEAWLVPAAGEERGRAIFVHGIAGAREDGYRHLSMLHEAGWTVLLITYRNDRGAPAAPNRRYSFGLTEWADLEAAVAYLSPGPDGPDLLVVADSMGGAILGQFLRQSALADRVGAIALDSPALEFRAVLDHLAAQTGRPLSGLFAAMASALAPRLTGLPLAEASVTATFAAYPGPLFVAHGAGDRIVPIGPSQDLAAARATTEVLWTEADHLGSFAADPAAYRAAFTRFLASLPAL
jgi:hypothetical protein